MAMGTLAERQNVQLAWDGIATKPYQTCTVTFHDGSQIVIEKRATQSMWPVRNGPFTTGTTKYNVEGEEITYDSLEKLIEERQPK